MRLLKLRIIEASQTFEVFKLLAQLLFACQSLCLLLFDLLLLPQ